MLKNTAGIKVDKPRIKMLHAIQDKKVKADYETISRLAKFLEKVPESVQEAYFLGLLDDKALIDIARINQFFYAASCTVSGINTARPKTFPSLSRPIASFASDK
jgi:hypothetical protein